MAQPTMKSLEDKLTQHIAVDEAFQKKLDEKVLQPLAKATDWWAKFRKAVVGAVGAILLTILAGTVGSFWNGYQSNAAAQKAAAAVQVAAPTPAEQARRDAREKQIAADLTDIKSKLGN